MYTEAYSYCVVFIRESIRNNSIFGKMLNGGQHTHIHFHIHILQHFRLNVIHEMNEKNVDTNNVICEMCRSSSRYTLNVLYIYNNNMKRYHINTVNCLQYFLHTCIIFGDPKTPKNWTITNKCERESGKNEKNTKIEPKKIGTGNNKYLPFTSATGNDKTTKSRRNEKNYRKR